MPSKSSSNSSYGFASKSTARTGARLAAVTVLLASSLMAPFLSGCSLFGPEKPDPVQYRQRVYFYAYEEVERAMKHALVRYPPKIDNPDAGVYETDWVKGSLRFKPAHKDEKFADGYRYRLLVRLVRGKSETKPAIKVIVSKVSTLQRDFFAEEETLNSDGLEEMLLLYRIQRELVLDKAIRRSQEKANKASETADGAGADTAKEATGAPESGETKEK